MSYPNWTFTQIFKRTKDTLYHITGDITHYSFLIFRNPLLITIHDLGRYKELTGLKKIIFGWFWLKLPILLADKTTVVSEYTKNDIGIFLGKKYLKKVVVIHNPVPALFSNVQSRIKPQNEKFTILHIGTGSHKNLGNLLKALNNSDYHLVIIGKLDPYIQEILQDVTFSFEQKQNLSYEEVLHQYQRADLLSFVSLHEGFGMPIIEAQALGVPVITSKKCSLPEVGADSVHYIEDPLDALAIRAGIDQLATDNNYREMLIQKGFKNIERFSMDFISNKYIELYKSILEK